MAKRRKTAGMSVKTIRNKVGTADRYALLTKTTGALNSKAFSDSDKKILKKRLSEARGRRKRRGT